MTVLVAAMAGSLGALARYVISGEVQSRTDSPFPLGTAFVNLLGAFLLGVFVGASDGSLWWVAAAGLTGGLTTFSTWMVETIGLGLVPRPSIRALANVALLATLGVALAAVGYHLTN
jgi:fluoride exporter